MIRFRPFLRPGALAVPALLALSVALPAQAMPPGHGACGPLSRISVTGSGESRIAPDLAVIRLGVTSQADSAADAMAQNGQQQGAVIQALRDQGIESDDIQTSQMSLNPVMDHGEGRAPQITGYQASNVVTVRVAQTDLLGQVLDAIVDAGANEINGISFQREDAAEAEDDARRDAVADARHKAGVLAEAAGVELGPLLSLRDAPVSEGPQPMMMRAQAAQSSATPIEAGQVVIEAQVQMTYALAGDGVCAPSDNGTDPAADADPAAN